MSQEPTGGERNDETAQGGGWPPVSGADAQSAPRVGFCQDCGRPLTAETVRTVGTGVFCEPCLTMRVGGPNPGAGYSTVPPAGTPLQPLAGDANPTLAGWLGLIPGVGAMYNGQYAKAVAHLVIFVLLVSLKDNVSHVFDVFVAAWVFYQVLDAYQTAKARRDGMPLPNPFGLNDIGERFGYGRHWTNGAPPPPASAASSAPPPPPYGSAGSPVSPPASPVRTSGDWIGYVPPTQFAGNVPPTYAGYAASGQTAPYAAPPPAAASWTAVSPVAPVDPVMTAAAVTPSNANRLPAGAVWLIGLGVLILMANLVPHWGVSERWWPPVLLAGLSVWIFLRRLRRRSRWVCDLRAPVVLMVLAIYSACHAAYYMVSFGLFCAVLLILLGVLLLLERTVGSGPQIVAGYGPVSTESNSTVRASFVPTVDGSASAASGETAHTGLGNDEGKSR